MIFKEFVQGNFAVFKKTDLKMYLEETKKNGEPFYYKWIYGLPFHGVAREDQGMERRTEKEVNEMPPKKQGHAVI